MKHIRENNIVSISALSENASYPATNMLDEHPKRKFKAADLINSTVITVGIVGGCSHILLAGTNAATATVNVTDPSVCAWAEGDEWGGTTTTATAATDLATNGSFTSNINDWTDESTGSGSIAWSSGQMRITGSGASNVGKATQTFNTTANKVYSVLFDHPTHSSASIFIEEENSGPTEHTSTGTDTLYTFKATGSTSKLMLYVDETGYVDIDNVRIYEEPYLIGNWEFSRSEFWVTQLNGSSGGSVSFGDYECTITQGSNSVYMGTSNSFSATSGQTYSVTVKGTCDDASVTHRVNVNNSSVALDTSADLLQEDFTLDSGVFARTFQFTADTTGTVHVALLQGGAATEVTNYTHCLVHAYNDPSSQDEWANSDPLNYTGSVTQDSANNMLLIELSQTAAVPCQASITINGPGGEAVNCGVMTANVAATYAGKNPQYGLSKSQLDFSIKAENSNGSPFYKKRDIVRAFDLTAIMPRASTRELESFFREFGEAPTGWQLTDITGSDYLVFGRMEGSPIITDDYPNHSTVSWRIVEVL